MRGHVLLRPRTATVAGTSTSAHARTNHVNVKPPTRYTMDGTCVLFITLEGKTSVIPDGGEYILTRCYSTYCSGAFQQRQSYQRTSTRVRRVSPATKPKQSGCGQTSLPLLRPRTQSPRSQSSLDATRRQHPPLPPRLPHSTFTAPCQKRQHQKGRGGEEGGGGGRRGAKRLNRIEKLCARVLEKRQVQKIKRSTLK